MPRRLPYEELTFTDEAGGPNQRRRRGPWIHSRERPDPSSSACALILGLPRCKNKCTSLFSASLYVVIGSGELKTRDQGLLFWAPELGRKILRAHGLRKTPPVQNLKKRSWPAKDENRDTLANGILTSCSPRRAARDEVQP